MFGPHRDYSATIHFGAVALRWHAPRRVRNRSVLHQLQHPCPTNRLQDQAVTLDCLCEQCVLVLLLQSTQFPQSLLSACSICGSSIVAPRPMSLGRISPRRRPLLRTSTDAKARRTSRISAATPTTNNFSRIIATGHSALSERLPPVSVYLAGSPSADLPSAERPRELLDDEIKQFRA